MTSVAAKGDTRYTALQESSSEDGQGENGDHSKRATPGTGAKARFLKSRFIRALFA